MTYYKLYIGNGLKRVRDEKQKTQMDLSLSTDLTLKYIYKLEKNISSPSSTTLDKLAKGT
ncbi:helix-turn-helix transcriptional regulator [Neobacillus sp. CF12]|uniref:helix-turn-helix domain-containing protein n=1 Tax=Neobacillus sp. CF12 TaxID=3055864 RepID=UPI0025A2CF4A|nr:helix-turn-helix transcriptional regulator [Neobacillus sp. CF12]MDM5329856.1 helix-turn-helix transcriptional regulator [Neobacillus sp. CF12]